MTRLLPGLPRWLEAAAAVLGLMVALPLLLVAALAIATTSRGPVIYRQERAGQGGRSFTLYKLRTMEAGNRGPQVTARGDNRVTRVGRVLRKTKLDELPELWNVVKGDMGLVGPRPEVPRFVQHNAVWREVLAVRPGITDPVTLVLRNEEDVLANVDGDAETFYRTVLQPYKLQCYLKYLRERDAWSDIRILVSTIHSVLRPSIAPAPKPEQILAWTRMGQAASAPDTMKSAKGSS